MDGIRGEGLSKKYGDGETQVIALQEAFLNVERGELAALLGPSGSGKTTLLMSLGLLILPDKGDVYVDDRKVISNGSPTVDLAEVRRTRLGFVFQKANLIPFLTVLDNVLLMLEINGQSGRAARGRALELLGYLGMGDRARSLPEQLSGGQQQRVAIARALAASPAVILADEPSAALDGPRTRDVMALFRQVARDHRTAVIVVTHDHRTLEFFDTIHEMEDGVLKEPRRHERPSEQESKVGLRPI